MSLTKFPSCFHHPSSAFLNHSLWLLLNDRLSSLSPNYCSSLALRDAGPDCLLYLIHLPPVVVLYILITPALSLLIITTRLDYKSGSLSNVVDQHFLFCPLLLLGLSLLSVIPPSFVIFCLLSCFNDNIPLPASKPPSPPPYHLKSLEDPNRRDR
jgi:hypothetical protein